MIALRIARIIADHLTIENYKLLSHSNELIMGVGNNERQPLVGARSDPSSSDGNGLASLFRGKMCTAAFIAVAGIIFIIGAFELSFVVPPGEVGIVVTLGHVEAFDPGLHFKAPFISSVVMLSTKTQLLEENNVIPTLEGLSVKLDTAVLYRLDSAKAADLYMEVGAEYVDVLIRPEASSAIRGLTSESDAKALYSSGRNTIQTAVKEELQQTLEPRGIIVEDVLLKDIVLPEELTKSIELKAQAEQDAARMEFVLNKERQEAERKAIEAQGIADFQRIVSEGISEELLKWKGIEATEKLAESQNTKIVIMGNSNDGLPVILSAERGA